MFISGGLVSGLGSIDHASVVDRTHRDALRIVEVADALGALFRVDEEDAILFVDGDIRAFGFTGGTARALRSDDLVGQFELLSG
jgi:hypothetical protein